MPILVIQKDLYHAGSLTYVYQDFGSVENIFDEIHASYFSLIIPISVLRSIAHNIVSSLVYRYTVSMQTAKPLLLVNLLVELSSIDSM